MNVSLAQRLAVKRASLGWMLLWFVGISLASRAQTNFWVNSGGSGTWDDGPSWSLGVPPGAGQAVFVANHGWKAVPISQYTSANFPQTMSIDSLTVISPGTDTVNTVLLEYAGLQTPLSVAHDLYVSNNARMVIQYSAVQVGGNFTVGGSVSHDVNSIVQPKNLQILDGGVYDLTNGSLTVFLGGQESVIGSGQFRQEGGSNYCFIVADSGEYDLIGGQLVLQVYYPGGGLLDTGHFIQSGGTLDGLVSVGITATGGGQFQLTGGLLRTPYFQLPADSTGSAADSSWTSQSGGTNIAGLLRIGATSVPSDYPWFGLGSYVLTSGLIVSTNLAINGRGSFYQSGGIHTNGTMTLSSSAFFHQEQPGGNSYSYYQSGTYSLSGGILLSDAMNLSPGTFSQTGGLLTVSNLSLSGGANFIQTGGTITQSGTLTLADADLSAGPGAQQFGFLQLNTVGGTNSIFTLSPGACALHFANSSSLIWSNAATLIVSNWSGSLSGGGSQQIFFGTSVSGLTSQQLSQVQFSNPAGLPSGTYTARILSNGEVVPDQGQSQGGTNSGTVNSWISQTGGNWDDAASWSLGVPPGSTQSVMFTNAYWKAVTIDASTVSSSPQSLAVNSLTITSVSPTNGLYTTRNTLLLNYAGAGNPLVVGVDTNAPGSLLVDSNSTVAMFSSGLIVNNALGETNSHIGEFQVDGNFIQCDNSEVVAGFLDLNGTYNLTNGMLFVGDQFINGRFNQQGGRNLGSMDMESTNSDYELFEGVVQGDVAVRAGTFHQWGGTNLAALITGYRGTYSLAGGLLMPGDLVVGSPPQNFLQFAGGGIEQTGGTNDAGNISMVFGFYNLRGGRLSAQSLTLTTNTLLGGLYAGFFNQIGGYHTNGGIIITGGRNQQNDPVTPSYTLNGGTLETPSITMNLGGFNHQLGTNRVGTLSLGNVGTYVINNGLLIADWIQIGSGSAFYHSGVGSVAGMKNILLANGRWVEQTSGVQLGQLQISTGTNSFLYLPSGGCVIRFADSGGVAWSNEGRLTIQGWSGSLNGSGAQQIFFGTSGSGLTVQQLSQVQFLNPAGLPSGTYGVQILSNGEVVPNQNSSSSGPVDSWINPNSGHWDDGASWSLGMVPNSSRAVVIANAGSKTVSLNPSALITFPGSMTVNNLFIDGTSNTVNTLLLNNFGTAVPLTVLNGLALQDGGQIVNFNSGLVVQSGTFMVTNSDLVQDGGFIRATNGPVYFAGSELHITNGLFEGGSVSIGYPKPARLNQYGGKVRIANLGLASFTGGTIANGISLYGGTLDIAGGMDLLGESGGVSYFQSGGTNHTTQVTIEPDYGGFVGGFTLNGGLLADSGVQLMAGYRTSVAIDQNGGSHVITNTLYMAGSSPNGSTVDPATYNLNGGKLSAGVIELNANEGDSVFVQTNGTIFAGTIYTHSTGFFSGHNTIVNLLGGSLNCSNYTTVDGGGRLNQTGGALVVSNLLNFGGSRDAGPIIYGRYTFTGGTLTASNINITGDWIIGDGTNRISNPGTISLWHTLVVSNTVEQFGRFILPTTTSIYLSGSASRLSFASGSGETWAGGATLVIFNWNGNLSGSGAAQVKFGSDPSGLTATQLNQIRFRIGSDLYSAKILNTGEVVPDQAIAPPLTYSQQGNQFTLNWLPGYTLQTATSPSGPFQDVWDPTVYIITSPYTYDMTRDPQRFFRLRQ